MEENLPLDKLILDTQNSKYKLVIEAANRAKQIKEEKKELNPEEKIAIRALKSVLIDKYKKAQKDKEKSSSKKNKE